MLGGVPVNDALVTVTALVRASNGQVNFLA